MKHIAAILVLTAAVLGYAQEEVKKEKKTEYVCIYDLPSQNNIFQDKVVKPLREGKAVCVYSEHGVDVLEEREGMLYRVKMSTADYGWYLTIRVGTLEKKVNDTVEYIVIICVLVPTGINNEVSLTINMYQTRVGTQYTYHRPPPGHTRQTFLDALRSFVQTTMKQTAHRAAWDYMEKHRETTLKKAEKYHEESVKFNKKVDETALSLFVVEEDEEEDTRKQWVEQEKRLQ